MPLISMCRHSIAIATTVIGRGLIVVRRTFIIALFLAFLNGPTTHRRHLTCKRILLRIRDFVFSVLLVRTQSSKFFYSKLGVHTSVQRRGYLNKGTYSKILC